MKVNKAWLTILVLRLQFCWNEFVSNIEELTMWFLGYGFAGMSMQVTLRNYACNSMAFNILYLATRDNLLSITAYLQFTMFQIVFGLVYGV